jgi:hypothetical protein
VIAAAVIDLDSRRADGDRDVDLHLRLARERSRDLALRLDRLATALRARGQDDLADQIYRLMIHMSAVLNTLDEF